MNKKFPSDDDLNKLLDRLCKSACSPEKEFSAENSFELFRERLPQKKRLPQFIRYASAVAAVFIAVFISAQLYLYLSGPDIITIASTDRTKEIVLPDGSVVTLNRYSSLTYPKEFDEATRNVTLSGEGYFNVTRNEEYPFIVQAGEVLIKALGTRFNVHAYPNDPDIKTSLIEGSVAVGKINTSDVVILQPDEVAIFDKKEAAMYHKVGYSAEKDINWLSGAFIFNDTPLEEIARELSNCFNTEIRIEDASLKNYKLTAGFESGESLREILSLLQTAAGNFTYVTEGKVIVIKQSR